MIWKKNQTRGLFHVWLGLYANLLVAFFSFIFVSFGMWAYLGFGDSGFWGLGRFIFVLIISFSRFQYFNIHFGSLKLCFTNLVLEIQDNLSLIFLSSLGDIKLDLFYLFSAIPHHYGSYLKIQAQVCPICQNLINPKQSGYDFIRGFYGHFSAC